jgi:hypothetical protein
MDDRRATEHLDAAQREAETRGEMFWISEILRLQAVADRRFGGGHLVAKLLDEAERLATSQGALLVLPRIAATRAN